MFSLRQAFNAGIAGFSGLCLAFALKAHQPGNAAVDTALFIGTVIMAGMQSKNPSP
jgi:hypothetical protein